METGRSLEVADHIISAIMKKLKANQLTLAKSRSGHVSWRVKDGKIEVFLEPKI